jgi:hypothetical protein
MTNSYGQSAFAGGVAEKWGNRYEARWTIWRGVLPVLRGEFDALQVEPPDLAGEAAGFRLYSRASNGTRRPASGRSSVDFLPFDGEPVSVRKDGRSGITSGNSTWTRQMPVTGYISVGQRFLTVSRQSIVPG